MSEPWFDPNTFGAWYGSLVGGGTGVLGGTLGALAGLLAPRGKGRVLVLGGMVLLVIVGLANLAFGIYALIQGQPYGIWYGPVLVGVILTLVCGGLIPVVQTRYKQAEQRRMEADEFRRI